MVILFATTSTQRPWITSWIDKGPSTVGSVVTLGERMDWYHLGMTL